MSTKSKGSRAERELFHLLWENFGACIRAAGSGSTSKPAPDLLASNGKRTFAIECKSLKGQRQYFDSKELEELRLFARMFGAEAWIGVRFDNKGWWFVPVEKVEKTKGNSFCL